MQSHLYTRSNETEQPLSKRTTPELSSEFHRPTLADGLPVLSSRTMQSSVKSIVVALEGVVVELRGTRPEGPAEVEGKAPEKKKDTRVSAQIK
jgi:hypothetical protein